MKILIDIPEDEYKNLAYANHFKLRSYIESGEVEKVGQWIDDEFGSKCSCCGIYTHLDKFDRPMKFKCCSMCGAKMKELRDEK